MRWLDRARIWVQGVIEEAKELMAEVEASVQERTGGGDVAFAGGLRTKVIRNRKQSDGGQVSFAGDLQPKLIKGSTRKGGHSG